MWATELDFGGVDAEAHDINDLNEIVGWVNDPGNNPELPRAMFYKNGTATWIMDQAGYYNTHAHGMNNGSILRARIPVFDWWHRRQHSQGARLHLACAFRHEGIA